MEQKEDLREKIKAGRWDEVWATTSTNDNLLVWIFEILYIDNFNPEIISLYNTDKKSWLMNDRVLIMKSAISKNNTNLIKCLSLLGFDFSELKVYPWEMKQMSLITPYVSNWDNIYKAGGEDTVFKYALLCRHSSLIIDILTRQPQVHYHLTSEELIDMYMVPSKYISSSGLFHCETVYLETKDGAPTERETTIFLSKRAIERAIVLPVPRETRFDLMSPLTKYKKVFIRSVIDVLVD